VIVQNDSTLEFAAGFLDHVSKNDFEDLIMKSLQGKITQIVELNPKLELVDIRSFKGMKIERILYDIRTKIE